ncbi:Fe-S-cluster containining protein [Desulfobaculum xiamenense]|uniref:Fe-S-cluster containining protein n=1 Tax=Desulfobaculum xiamenense TaxID=995050 RepID=A0A846QVZ7_9BACT|nr:YkgJ family cysteine cluster protein [Desulfobaculum xiamenense]NJB69294.1 Fe-S-cluster containining protein [Desulfobaculum xiamenense]
MELDFSDIFEKYEALVADVDKVFAHVQAEHGDCVKCSVGCSDCCHALFDLSLVEALYLNTKFNERFAGQERSDILDRADEADRQTYKIKREAFKASREGALASEIMDMIAKARVRCSLLNDEGKCDLYDSRPVTCRLYGVPTAIGGRAHTCAKAGFEPGKQYPTVRIEKIQDRLMELSREIADAVESSYDQLSEMLVPLSMSLMNTYDAEFLGAGSKKNDAPAAAAPAQPTAPAPGAVAAEALSGKSCSTCGEKPGSSACDTCGGGTVWEIGASPERK